MSFPGTAYLFGKADKRTGHYTMRLKILVATLLCMVSLSLRAQSSPNYLANNTVLIIRHAEKPETGTGLTPMGEARARLYAEYFKVFREEELEIPIDSLYAGADSKNSVRPRLTLEPLSKATGLPLHHEVGTDESETLVRELKSETHGQHPLIAWRHGQIPTLLTAFGVAPEKLLPNGKWPDDVYDWVIVLKIGQDGQLTEARLIHENLRVIVSVP
jgi:hypothetical protein